MRNNKSRSIKDNGTTLAVMTPQHPRWNEFCERLGGPEGCNFVEIAGSDPVDWTWQCDHTHRQAIAILLDMGFTEDQIAASVEYWEAHGGYCDCEILFNVDEEDEDG